MPKCPDCPAPLLCGFYPVLRAGRLPPLSGVPLPGDSTRGWPVQRAFCCGPGPGRESPPQGFRERVFPTLCNVPPVATSWPAGSWTRACRGGPAPAHVVRGPGFLCQTSPPPEDAPDRARFASSSASIAGWRVFLDRACAADLQLCDATKLQLRPGVPEPPACPGDNSLSPWFRDDADRAPAAARLRLGEVVFRSPRSGLEL